MKTGMISIENLRRHLLEVARRHPPVDAVPYAFEKRIMARLAGRASFDSWWIWNRVLWRCAAPCIAITLLVGGVAWYGQQDMAAAESLAADLETAICAPIADSQEVW